MTYAHKRPRYAVVLRRVLVSTALLVCSTELCTGATAHTHKDKDHHRGRCRPVTEQSQGLAPPGYLVTCPERQLDNLDHAMIGYRHPPLFTHEHGCVTVISRKTKR